MNEITTQQESSWLLGSVGNCFFRLVVTAAEGWRVGRGSSEASGSLAAHKASGALAGAQSNLRHLPAVREDLPPGTLRLLDMQIRGSAPRAGPCSPATAD